MFVEVTQEKLVGGGGFLFPPILNRVKIEDLRMLQYILKNSLIKISTSHRSSLKMAGSCHASISKKNKHEQMACFFSGPG